MNGFFRQKYGLMLFIGIFIAIGLTYWFGIRKVMEAIRVNRDEIQKMLVIRENRNHQLGRLEEYGTQYAGIVSDEKWLDVFVGRDNMIEFVRRLESLAEDEKVSVTLEARDSLVLKPVKKKAAAGSADGKNAEDDDSSTSAGKKEKKDPSIIESLPSTAYTYLGLHVSGETAKVVRYLRKVESLPIVLDIIAIEALRKENPDFSRERVPEQPVPVGEKAPLLVSTSESVPEETVGENPFTPSEKTGSGEEIKAFEVEVTADLVVYHEKE